MSGNLLRLEKKCIQLFDKSFDRNVWCAVVAGVCSTTGTMRFMNEMKFIGTVIPQAIEHHLVDCRVRLTMTLSCESCDCAGANLIKDRWRHMLIVNSGFQDQLSITHDKLSHSSSSAAGGML
jgi:hypothetical protein